MSFDINSFLIKAVEAGCSDVHLTVDENPTLRMNGKMVRANVDKLTPDEIDGCISTLVPRILKEKNPNFLDLDFSYEIKDVSRFRVNIAHNMSKPKITIRVVPFNVKPLAELGLPDYVEKFTTARSGLVLVTGKTSSGKSTTLASLINEINRNYQKHIITLEDPIEFVFTNQKSIITQRQIEVDTESFSSGVKYALRQDPDVILVGEIRDQDSIRNALMAAETGILVFGTLHTKDTTQTISRIVNMFEPEYRDIIRENVADVLVGIISQKLLPGTDKKRYLACEVLVNTPTIRDLIKKGELDEIYKFLSNSTYEKMNSMNQSIYDLLKRELITEMDALSASENKTELQQMLRGVSCGSKG